MYSYRTYDSSWARNGSSRAATVVKENGTMGRHTSASPPPITVGDGKRRPIRDRLHNITSAMTWIKEELEGIKEQDKTLIEIFKKVQGDVKELNGFVVNHRNSSSLQGTPSSASIQPPPPLPPASQQDASLELDFDALDDELSDSGEHKTSSLSGTPSPPLPSTHSRGLTDSGTSYSNLDTQSSLDLGGSRENIAGRMPGRSDPPREIVRENGVVGSKDSTPMSPTISISLGSLDLDFDFPTSFGLGTIAEGRSLMNIPSTVSETTGNNQGPPSSVGNGAGTQKAAVLQRSVSQQPLQTPSVAEKGRNTSCQSPKKVPPQTAPKPRRDSYKVTHPAPPPPTGAASQRENPSSKPPGFARVGRQTSEMRERLSPQQARKEMMKSTPALFPSPPRTRRNTDSLPRNSSQVMTPLLPFQAQQELREAANRAKQEAHKKSSNGVIPHMTQGSPILLRKGGAQANQKQPSPPLSYRGTAKQSPRHGQRNSPTASARLYHLSPGGMKGSSSMTRLAPSSPSPHSRGAQEEGVANISRNSSMDSGIQYSSEGETGGVGGATTGERASNTSTTTSDSVATTTSLASSEGKEAKIEDSSAKTEEEKKKGLGDFSDVLSVIANMGGGDSWFS